MAKSRQPNMLRDDSIPTALPNLMPMNVSVKNLDILGGTPVFRGTRVPIQTLFDYLITNPVEWLASQESSVAWFRFWLQGYEDANATKVEQLKSWRLNLARAYALQGDSAKAKTAYQDFFATWKDADPDIPVLIAAKSEYAKLK